MYIYILNVLFQDAKHALVYVFLTDRNCYYVIKHCLLYSFTLYFIHNNIQVG